MNYPKAIKILALSANPINTDQLRLDVEVRGIKEELERAQYRDRFEFVNEGAVRVDDLSRAMLKHKPDIVHFSGHGSGEQGLVLENDSGKAQYVSTEALGRLFKWGRNTVKCVLLNACYSKAQAEAIHQNIDCVIGMNKTIDDRSAIRFAAKFYQALLDGESFPSSYEYACTALELSGSKEVSTPELLNRIEGSDPLGIATPDPGQMKQSQAAEPSPRAQQSQSIGNISISGNNNPFNVMQTGGNVNLTQTNTQITGQTSSGNSDLQTALEALAQLKQLLATTDVIDEMDKETVAVPIQRLETELRKPQPDRSVAEKAIAKVKNLLDGVITLAEPVTKVAALVAKALGGL